MSIAQITHQILKSLPGRRQCRHWGLFRKRLPQHALSEATGNLQVKTRVSDVIRDESEKGRLGMLSPEPIKNLYVNTRVNNVMGVWSIKPCLSMHSPETIENLQVRARVNDVVGAYSGRCCLSMRSPETTENPSGKDTRQ